MFLKVNGARVELPEGTTVQVLVAGRNLSPGMAVVEVNLSILPASAWPDHVLRENDEVEVLAFMGGGR
jgi:thiamine biosynthesis protein ThiS